MTTLQEFRCEVCGLVTTNPVYWFVIRCGDSDLTVYRWNSETCPWSLFKTNPRTVGSQQRATHADTSVAIAFRVVGVVVTRLPQRSKGTSTSKRSV